MGLAVAALTDLNPTVKTARINVIARPLIKTTGPISMRYSYVDSHSRMANQAAGEAKINARLISLKNDHENIPIMPETVAPITFLTPNSYTI